MNVRWKKNSPPLAYRKQRTKGPLLAQRTPTRLTRLAQTSLDQTCPQTSTLTRPSLRDDLPRIVSEHASRMSAAHIKSATTLLGSTPDLASTAFSTGGIRMSLSHDLELHKTHETAVSQWPLLKAQGKIKTVSVMGMTFEVAFVSKKDFPNHAAIDAAGFYWGGGFIAVIEDLKESPEVSAAELERFNKYMAVHELGEMIFAAEEHPHERATKLELAVAKSEGHLEDYLNFLKRHNHTKFRDIANQSAHESTPSREEDGRLVTTLQTLTAETVNTAYSLANAFEWPANIEKEAFASVFQEPSHTANGLFSHLYAASDQLIRGYHQAAAAVKDHLTNSDTSPTKEQVLHVQAVYLSKLAELHQTFENSSFNWKIIPPFILEQILLQSLQTHLTDEIINTYLTPFQTMGARHLVKIAGWIAEDAGINRFDTDENNLNKITDLLEDIQDTHEDHDGPWAEAATIHFNGETPLQWYMNKNPSRFNEQKRQKINPQFTLGILDGFIALGKGVLIQIFKDVFTDTYGIDIDTVIDSDLNKSLQTVWNNICLQNNKPASSSPLNARELRDYLESTPVTQGGLDHYGNAFTDYLAWVDQTHSSNAKVIEVLIDWITSRYTLEPHENLNLALEDIDTFLSAGWISANLAKAVIEKILTKDHLKAMGIIPSDFILSALQIAPEQPESMRALVMLNGENLLRTHKTEFCFQVTQQIMESILDCGIPQTRATYKAALDNLNAKSETQALKAELNLLQKIDASFNRNALVENFRTNPPQTLTEAKDRATWILMGQMLEILDHVYMNTNLSMSLSPEDLLKFLDQLLNLLKPLFTKDDTPFLQQALDSNEWKQLTYSSFKKSVPESDTTNPFFRKLQTQIENAQRLLNYFGRDTFTIPFIPFRESSYSALREVSPSLRRALGTQETLTEILDNISGFVFSSLLASRKSVQSSTKDKPGKRHLYQWNEIDIRLRRLIAGQELDNPEIYFHILFCETDIEVALIALKGLTQNRYRCTTIFKPNSFEKFSIALKKLGERFQSPAEKSKLNQLIQSNNTLITSEKRRLQAALA